MGKIKIGQISYTNILPVYHFIDRNKFNKEVEWIPQVPALLNEKMASGEIHLGPISSFAYAENHQNYSVLADLSISSRGPVRSIFLFSKKPIEQLKNAHIALTNTSATSVNLLKIILEKFMEGQPSYITCDPDLESMMQQADACLLIGDDALIAGRKQTPYHRYDLGELWYQHTGMWMTFAVWAVRNEVIEQDPDLLDRIHHAYLNSKDQGLKRMGEIIEVAGASLGGDEQFWKEYYQGLSYDLTSEQIKGLEYYYQCASELNLLPEPVQVRTWNAQVTGVETQLG